MVKFKRIRKFTKANIENVPTNKAIVYEIKSTNGANLYTGIAGRCRGQERLLEHKELKKDFIPGGTRFQFRQVKTKEIAKGIEKRIIKDEKPKFNIQHKK